MSHTKGKVEANGSKLVCEKGYAIATVNSVGTYEGQANAKRLVTAWNSHDALVEALERIIKADDLQELTNEEIEFARSVLKSAKGE